METVKVSYGRKFVKLTGDVYVVDGKHRLDLTREQDLLLGKLYCMDYYLVNDKYNGNVYQHRGQFDKDGWACWYLEWKED